MFRRVLTVAAVALLAVNVVACGDDDTNSSDFSVQGVDAIPTRNRAVEGDRVSDVEVERADGSTVKLSAYAGTPLVLNFWAAWCAPCQAELPVIQEVHAELGDRVRIVGIAERPDLDRSREMAAEVGLTYDLLEDPDGDALVAVEGVVMPVTAFVDADGTILEVHNGALTADGLRGLVREHFG